MRRMHSLGGKLKKWRAKDCEEPDPLSFDVTKIS